MKQRILSGSFGVAMAAALVLGFWPVEATADPSHEIACVMECAAVARRAHQGCVGSQHMTLGECHQRVETEFQACTEGCGAGQPE